jgi:hypothetical protein
LGKDMTIFLITLGYTVSAVLAFYLFQNEWRHKLDLTQGDAIVLGFFSAIPIVGLVISVCINIGWHINHPRPRSETVLLKKYKEVK